MAKTFEDINYRLRPAKSVERKMIVDLLCRLPHIRPLSEYRYIGFGSPYFTDVKLVHEELHIDDIISIEKEEDEKERFEFNKPYDCIDIKYEKSKDALPKLDWEQPTILWLDYTEELCTYMFSDIQEFMTRAPAGSAIFITINTHATPLHQLKEEDKTMLDELEERLPREFIPEDVTKKDLRGWDYAYTCRRIILNQIKEKYLDTRNVGLEEGGKLEFQQLVNFRYKDSSKMMTLGGILRPNEDSEGFANAGFEEFDFVQTGEDPYHIRTPILTFDEMRDLNKKLPGDVDVHDYHAPNRHVERYADLYRYFPKFIESEM